MKTTSNATERLAQYRQAISDNWPAVETQVAWLRFQGVYNTENPKAFIPFWGELTDRQRYEIYGVVAKATKQKKSRYQALIAWYENLTYNLQRQTEY